MTEIHAMNRCLVTGASGFLGGYLLEKLQQKSIFVRALVRQSPGKKVLCDELMVEELSPDAGYEKCLEDIDTIFYLAGTAHLSATSIQYEYDCLATLNLARQAAQRGIKRFVFVSTTKATIDEDAWPTEPYGYWKRKTEQQLMGIGISHLVIVRPCLIYGVGVKGNLQKMIQAIDKGYFPPLPDIQSQRSMVFGGDVADALLLAAMHPAANRQLLIVADGEPYTASALYAEIRKILGKAPAKWHIPLPILKMIGVVGDAVEKLGIASPVNSEAVKRLTDRAVFSAEKLRQLGWEPTTTFYHELPHIVSTLQRKA